ncbi:von Willebrand factor A domain-containing protein 5B2-like [Rhinatrema bivittatum]|uniref:von Willebrand factor A domain-containing protein 5B2-like n=1 Tax=Rhinatrema bivittatum TaxID=194408 RepID=UPI001127EB31|nr:von Willebrand factor A domain-containing protein 5B2-like [Rhinatrema bivittatum]
MEAKLFSERLESLKKQFHMERVAARKAAQRDLTEMKTALCEATSKSAELARANRELRQKVTELGKTVKNQQVKLKSQKKQIQQQLDAKASSGQNTERIKEIETELKQMELMKEEYQKKNYEQSQKIQKLIVEVTDLQNEMQKLAESQQEAVLQSREQESRLQAEKRERLELESRCQTLEDKVRHLKKLKEATEQKLKAASKESEQISANLEEAHRWFKTKFDSLQLELVRNQDCNKCMKHCEGCLMEDESKSSVVAPEEGTMQAIMPGLFSLSTWSALPLKASCVKAWVSGYTMGLTANLSYVNPENEPVEGIFIYPLAESEVVVSFEAVTSGRTISVHVQNRSRSEDCCIKCTTAAGLALQCTNGHLILDEDMERSMFVICTGIVAPSAVLSITLSSSQELPTLPSGAVQIKLPSILTPLVPPSQLDGELGDNSCDDSPTSCFGGGGSLKAAPSLDSLVPSTILAAFTEEPSNPCRYEFSFEMLVKGPCLLAGLESPTHALRADASPYASCASTICITLAEGHHCDRNLEIILHPSEPHEAHLLVAEGALTFQEYVAHVKSRRDYLRAARKDSTADRKVAFLRKRFHKDILLNPVLMLNLCPDLDKAPTDLRSVTREIIFIIDRSSSMSLANLEKIKEALLVTVKSLPSRTLLNLIEFGSSVRALFSTSKLCTRETSGLLLEHIQKLRADMGDANVLAALTWSLGQPVHRGYPRQLFLLTAATVNNTGKVIELVRQHASTNRCFSFGFGSSVCHRLLKGVAKVSGGRAEFFCEGERLQPKLIRSLKKSVEPAVSDITIDWYVPDTAEALLSPNEIAPLYPGGCLTSYCTLYPISSFRSKRNTGKERGCKSASPSSSNSVFHSQDDAYLPGGPDAPAEPEDPDKSLHEISLELSPSGTENWDKSGEASASCDIRSRICQASYIQKQYMLTHCSVSSERSHTTSHGSTSSESTGSHEVAFPQCLKATSQQGQKSVVLWEPLCRSSPLARTQTTSSKNCSALSSEELAKKQKALVQATMSGRSFSSPHGELDMHRLRWALEKVSQSGKRKQSLEGRLQDLHADTEHIQRPSLSRRSLADSSESGNLLSPSQLDWDTLLDPQCLFAPSLAAEDTSESECTSRPVLQCRVVIQGLSAGKPVAWEVMVSLESLFHAKETKEEEEEDQHRDKLLHHLMARSVIRDNEMLAERESELERGSSRRFRLKAIQCSKGCGVVSTYTYLEPIDFVTQEPLRETPGIRNAGLKFIKHQGSRSGSRRQRSYSAGLGRRSGSDEMEESVLLTDRAETPASPISLSSACGWEKESFTEGHMQSLPVLPMGSQRSVENFFGSSRFSLGKRRVCSSSGKLSPLKPPCLSAESELCCESESQDYLPLVRLQLVHGAFQLNDTFAQVVQIPLDRLLRASPYSSHRASISPVSSSLPRALIPKSSSEGTPANSSCKQPISSPPDSRDLTGIPRATEDHGRALHYQSRHIHEGGSEPHTPLGRESRSCLFYVSYNSCPEVLGSGWQQADSGRGSETDTCENSPAISEGGLNSEGDLEGCSWATAVALAWLEHQCAGFFTEWELVAAKADNWLQDQRMPEGVDLASLKGAARHLFLLLRHWDENIKLNVLCYNPNTV